MRPKKILEEEIKTLKEELDIIHTQKRQLTIEINELKQSLTYKLTKKIDKIIQTVNPSLLHKYHHTIKNIRRKSKEKKHSKKIKRKKAFKKKPLLSIIMPTYNTNNLYLDEAIKSIIKQSYKKWELIIVDDGSKNKETIEYLKKINHPQIKAYFNKKNEGISKASNEALKHTKGEYILIVDHDDYISEDALLEMVEKINQKDYDFIYSNENVIDEKGRIKYEVKKVRFALDYLLENNYITHLSCIKKEIIEKVGGFRKEYDGAQDHDLFLRITEKTKKIGYINKSLYSWRSIKGSTAYNINQKPYALTAGKRAIEDYFKRNNIDATVKINKTQPAPYIIRRDIKGDPKVSIIIPFKDKFNYLKDCLDSIIKKSTYKNYEIICVNNNSTKIKEYKEIKNKYKKNKHIKFYDLPIPFNYSKINNTAVNKWSTGEHILFLNNDIKIISKDWIERMLEFSQLKDTGTIGAKLLFKDHRIQHAGIWLNPKLYEQLKYTKEKLDKKMNRGNIVQNPESVTAACLMIKKETFKEIGEFDEKLKVAYNDIDLCIKAIKKGYRTVYTPHARLYHFESKTRGYDYESKEKEERNSKELNYILKKHHAFLTEITKN